MIVYSIIVFAQQSLPADPISGGAGWVGAGLLGLVLSWLLLVHLPAKDKQIKELAEAKDNQLEKLLLAQREERQADRLEIKEVVEAHQRVIDKLINSTKEEFNRDREAFDKRNLAIVQAINQQTKDLQTEIKAMCKYNGQDCHAISK